ncbi:MAG TPA: biopolymer transporter ExbD [Polyangiaceae bacterium LLY-WYZ-14_1]|jgi:biopolymer transport protein ExbD|nr:biopolymer transporter ExbD [Polyangiaceae bacterium LLY-WYZ-14_1]
MAKLTAQQRNYIRKRTKFEEPDPSEMSSELNIIPFLDITVNLIMFLLMSVAAIAFFTQITSSLPNYGSGARRSGSTAEKSLNLNLFITDRGVTVTGSSGKLQPGCETVTSGQSVTVPLREGAYDWNGLSECLKKVKSQFQDETEVTIAADPEIPYEVLVGAMDASRNDGDQELFPDILLSAGVR